MVFTSLHCFVVVTSMHFLPSRFWDLAYPERSYVVAGGTSSPSVCYYRKVIEGTEVVQVRRAVHLWRHKNIFGLEF